MMQITLFALWGLLLPAQLTHGLLRGGSGSLDPVKPKLHWKEAATAAAAVEVTHKTMKHGKDLSDQYMEKEVFNCPCRDLTGQKLCTCESLEATVERLLHAHRRNMHECIGRSSDWHPMLRVARSALEAHGIQPPSEQGYQFGVFSGRSLRSLAGLFPETFFWGFDSFQGMPENNEAKTVKAWHKGEFHMKGGDPINGLQKWSRQFWDGKDRLGFVKGFYNESLKPGLAQEQGMVAARYVDVDCDLYSSSETSLDWMFSSGLIKPGTLVGYDDWWVLPCSGTEAQKALSPLELGEGLAHVQMAKKYGVQFRCVAGPCAGAKFVSPWLNNKTVPAEECSPYTTWGPIFLVEAVGVPASEGGGQHGFGLSKAQIAEYKATSCPEYRY